MTSTPPAMRPLVPPPVLRASAPAQLSAQSPSPTHDQAVTLFLTDRDVACPQCRFNLRSLRSARCPECGLPIKLSVENHRSLRVYHIGLMMLAAGFGAAGGVVGVALVQSTMEALSGRLRFSVDYDPEHLFVSVLFVAVFGPALIVWIFQERLLRIRRPLVGLIGTLIATLALVTYTVIMGFMG